MLESHPLFDKRLLALDWGEKFIGLASFHVGRDPFVLTYGRIKGGIFTEVWKNLKKILDDESIDLIIVGVPFFTDGKAGSTTHKVNQFLQELQNICPLPIKTQDETLSTFEAEERMKKSPRYNFQVNLSEIDAVSASIILEDFLRTQGLTPL
jgi:putative holliday junction resolvase